jgi:hypothetical protein
MDDVGEVDEKLYLYSKVVWHVYLFGVLFMGSIINHYSKNKLSLEN